MATATISGTVVLPAAVGGANTSVILGAPEITPSSTTGAQLTYTESSVNSYNIPVGAPLVIPFGTISSADLVYIGTDQEIEIAYNGGTDLITLAAGGMDLKLNGGITAISIEPTTLAANVIVVLAGA
jgi:hypothetical protein